VTKNELAEKITGAVINIPASKAVRFKAWKGLKDAVR
jgi:nucleoid DNA-binding protein